MTQVDDEEIAKHSRIASNEPAGEGIGIAGEAAGAGSDDEERHAAQLEASARALPSLARRDASR
jgi:hypothetical protein